MFKFEKILLKKDDKFFEKLQAKDFYITDNGDTKIILENAKNKCLMFLTVNDNKLYLHLKNSNNEFFNQGWCLGNINDLFILEDIFEILEKKTYLDFANVRIHEGNKKFLAINKFFIVSEVEKFEQIIQKHGFMKLKINDDGTIDIINDDVNLTLRLFLNNNFVWIKDLSSKIGNCIGDVDEEKAEEFEKFLSSTIFSYRVANIKIHKGTEPKLTPKQEQYIVNKLEKEFNRQKTITQQKIIAICDEIADLLVYKNQKYGDSAIHPKNIFYKGNAENSILIRLDDKIGRITNNNGEIRTNDIVDIIGYLVLLLISKNVNLEEIQKLKD